MTHDATAPHGTNKGLVLAAMTLANAMILVDQTAVPLTLPDIMRQFEIGATDVQWVLTASLLPLAGLLVLGGRLGDTLGRRRVFLVGAILFAGASAAGGLAPVFELLIIARVAQGVGGALMLPNTVAIVSSTYSDAERGRALGTMGGVAAVAGAFGPTIGGVLDSALTWRAVLLVNAPIAVACVLIALRSIPADAAVDRESAKHVDTIGALLLCVTLVSLVFGLNETQTEPLQAVSVLVPLVVVVVAGVCFVYRERHAHSPLMSFSLFRKRDYLGATISQGLAGMAELGLGVIFPLVLILNLEMDPALAGVALIPTTVPMVLLAPIAGRWYDRVGGRTPLAFGFAVLAAAGVALAIGVQESEYLAILPGLLLYGVGLALVLTVNDPVSLDMVPDADQGQASGVSATAEQGGGAIGIALMYTLFHAAYIDRLHGSVNPASSRTDEALHELKAKLLAAEQTGLRPSHFTGTAERFLFDARSASELGYSVAFLAVTVIAIIGLIAVVRIVRNKADIAT